MQKIEQLKKELEYAQYEDPDSAIKSSASVVPLSTNRTLSLLFCWAITYAPSNGLRLEASITVWLEYDAGK